MSIDFSAFIFDNLAMGFGVCAGGIVGTAVAFFNPVYFLFIPLSSNSSKVFLFVFPYTYIESPTP